jgi:hypothetical protein
MEPSFSRLHVVNGRAESKLEFVKECVKLATLTLFGRECAFDEVAADGAPRSTQPTMWCLGDARFQVTGPAVVGEAQKAEVHIRSRDDIVCLEDVRALLLLLGLPVNTVV